MQARLSRFFSWPAARCAVWLVGLGWCGLVFAQAATPDTSAERTQERAQLQAQRKGINDAHQRAQAACYKQFAVEDCLKAARTRTREALAPIKAREMQLNDDERREKAVHRLQSVEAATAARSSDTATTLRSQGAQVKSAPNHAQDAQQRARVLQERQRAHVAQQAKQDADNAARAQRAQAHLEMQQKTAAERRERLRRQQEQDALAGKKPAASLPSPAASAP